MKPTARSMVHLPQQVEVNRFLSTGDYDNSFENWPGDTFLERVTLGDAALRNTLISTVLDRTEHVVVPEIPNNDDLNAFVRAKLAPMVRGLFPQREHAIVLEMLGRAVVFLSPATITAALKRTPWLSTAWNLANLYLESAGVERLSADAPEIVGLSEETTCYVSVEYFRTDHRFEDYVVHEAAHIFHNCKRETIGLPATRNREWLLEIDFAKRETFAYACEAYGRILELGGSRSSRQRLLSELADGAMPPDDRVEGAEYVEILREAISVRNGWKCIRERCASPRPTFRREIQGALS